MTAFADLLDLRTAVVEQVGRADIAEVFPRLVLLAEARFNRTFRIRDQITNATLTMVDGRATLPADYAEMIGLYAPDGCEYVQQSPQHQHGYFYSIQGSDVVAAQLAGALSMDYYATVPTITGSMAGSNWLLQKYPGVYLYGAAFEAAKWMRDRELASDMGGLLTDEINEARADDERSRYSRARVRVAGVTP